MQGRSRRASLFADAIPFAPFDDRCVDAFEQHHQLADVDFDERQIRVARAFTQAGWGEPKSGRGRSVDLSSDAVAMLAAIQPSGAGRTALVFPAPSGNPIDEKAVYRAYARASDRAELGRSVGPHKLRHTFASHHAMRGTPLPQIQQWMGHADITTTMRYAHLCPAKVLGLPMPSHRSPAPRSSSSATSGTPAA